VKRYCSLGEARLFRLARKTSYSNRYFNHLTDSNFEAKDVILPPEYSHCGQQCCLSVGVNFSDDDFAKIED